MIFDLNPPSPSPSRSLCFCLYDLAVSFPHHLVPLCDLLVAPSEAWVFLAKAACCCCSLADGRFVRSMPRAIHDGTDHRLTSFAAGILLLFFRALHQPSDSPFAKQLTSIATAGARRISSSYLLNELELHFSNCSIELNCS